MTELSASPLCPKSDINVYRPSIDFFIEKIKNKDFFSFTRQMHGLWDAIIAAWIVEPSLRNIQFEDKRYIAKLAAVMSKAKKDIEDLYYEPSFYAELLSILQNLPCQDSSFLFGISDTYFFPEMPPPYQPQDFVLPEKCNFKYLKTDSYLKYYKLRFQDRQKVIQLLLPKEAALFDAMIWKMYAYENKIWDFFGTIRQHPIVLIGANHYQNFGEIAKLPNYKHIPIHGSKASLERDKILEKVQDIHQELEQSLLPPIYFFVAGSVSVWLVYHLHQSLKNKFLIDVGQAFNFLYPSNQGLLHREFGYSKSDTKQRRAYQTNLLYGARNFHSKMIIEDKQVDFELNLKFKDIWFEKLMLLLNERGIRRKLMKWRYYILNTFS